MNASPPERPNGLTRSQILGLTLLADVVAAILIVFVLPLAWSTRLVVLAISLTAVNFASRALLRRQGSPS